MKHINYEKLKAREDHYLNLGKQALSLLEKRSISPKGLAVPPSQIQDAADDFMAKFEELLERAYDKGWRLGLQDAAKTLQERAINVTYLPIPDNPPKPSEGFLRALERVQEVMGETIPVLQQASGNPKDLEPLKRVVLACISLYANEAYTQSYLSVFVQAKGWLSAYLRNNR